MERLTAARLELFAPYTGDGIEYLDKARPYLPKIDPVYGWQMLPEDPLDTVVDIQARDVLTKHFAWAVPDEEALAAVAELSPIVEVGAGSGYWAKLLRERGAKVAAYDRQPYPLFNSQISYSWVAMTKGGPQTALRDHPERTLLLCWPSYELDWAAQALELHRGEHMVYVGEGPGGCTANDRFHELLDAFYEEIRSIRIPQWFGLHDGLTIYRRLDEV
jgi:hypothetical protein